MRVFELLEGNKNVYEYDEYGDIWAVNYDKAAKILKDNGIENPDNSIEVFADYYGLDIL